MVDPLTQLANRKGFEEFLERTIALHTLSGEPASLLMIDMDEFNIANDKFGHDVGDAALRTVGDCLTRVSLRRCDLVCRYGGDEFAVLLAETASTKAATLGERVASAVREARMPDKAAACRLHAHALGDRLEHLVAEPIDLLQRRIDVRRHAEPVELLVNDRRGNDTVLRPEPCLQLGALDAVDVEQR